MDDETDTIAELFSRDPLQHTHRSIERIVEDCRQARANFKLTGKVTAVKRPVDLTDLGLV